MLPKGWKAWGSGTLISSWPNSSKPWIKTFKEIISWPHPLELPENRQAAKESGKRKFEKEKNWVINDSLRWKKIFDLALHGFKRKLVFLTINKPLPPLLVVPTSRLPSRETLEGGGRDNPPTWPPPSWDPNPLRLPLWSSRGKGVVQGISYSKRVTYYIRLAAAPNPWVGFPGQCGPMVG